MKIRFIWMILLFLISLTVSSQKTADYPFSTYTNVIRDDNKYCLYHRGLPTTKGEATNAEVTCYPESTDGIHWTKPDLNVFKIMDLWNKNVVVANTMPASHILSPLLNRSGFEPANGKYKALGGLRDGLVESRSDDGIHWEKINEDPVVGNSLRYPILIIEVDE